MGDDFCLYTDFAKDGETLRYFIKHFSHDWLGGWTYEESTNWYEITEHEYNALGKEFFMDCEKSKFDVWHTFCIDVSPSSKEDFLNTYLIISNYLDKVKPKISAYFNNRELKSFYIRFVLFDVTSVNVEERIFSFDTDKYELLMYLQKKLFLEPRKNIKGSPMGLEAILTALNFDDKKRNNTNNYSHFVYRNTIFVITTHETAFPSVELSELERDFEREAMCFLIAPETTNWKHYCDKVSNLLWYPGQLSDFVEEFSKKYGEINHFLEMFAPDI